MNSFTYSRLKAGLTQAEAAQRLGISQSAVAKWETDKSLPRGSTLLKMARLYGSTVGQLLGDEEEGDVQHDGQ